MTTAKPLQMPDRRDWADRLPWRPVVQCLPLALALWLIWRSPLTIGADCAMHLQYAQLLLEGQTPYVDFIDTNPPLMTYLNTAPVLLSRVFSLPLPTAFTLFVWALTVASAFGTRALLRSVAPQLGGATVEIVVLTFSAASVVIWRGEEYGHREHLFMLAYLPFLASRVRRIYADAAPAVGSGALLGLIAGLAASHKPHFIFVALAPEAYRVLRQRRWRDLFAPELIGFSLALAAYALHFLFLPPAMQAAFFGRWVPLMATRYDAYAFPLTMVLRHGGAWPGAAACAAAFLLTIRRRDALADFVRSLGVAALAGAVSYVLQRKGWAYQNLPAVVAGSCAAAALFGALFVERAASAFPVVRRVGARLRLPAFAIAAAALGVLLGEVALLPGPSDPAHRARFLQQNPLAAVVERGSPERGRVVFITTEVGYPYPLTTVLDRRPGSRYMWSFPIPMFRCRGQRDPEAAVPDRLADLPADERRFLEELGGDILRNQPSLVFVDANRYCLGCPQGFSILRYLTKTGFMNEYLALYRQIGAPEGLAVYAPRPPQ